MTRSQILARIARATDLGNVGVAMVAAATR